MKRGGVVKTRKYKSHKNAFDFFVENSSCNNSFNTPSSRYGLISHILLNPDVISPYISSNLDTFGEYINSLLIKVVFISSTKNKILKKTTMEESEFQREVDIQEKLYADTNATFQSVCPAIVFSKLISNRDYMKYILFKLFSINLDNIPKIFDKIGIIAMEFAEGYTTMNNSLTPENLEIPEQVAAFFIILYTAWKTGYSHGDFHKNNILIKHTNPENIYFDMTDIDHRAWQYREFKNIRPMLIDFGFAKELTSRQNRLLEKYIDENKYTEAASLITLVGRDDDLPDENSVLRFPSFYGWFSGAVSLSEYAKESMNYSPTYNMDITEYTRRRKDNLLKYQDAGFDLNDTIELLFRSRTIAEVNAEPIVERIQAALKIQNAFIKTRRALKI